MEVLVIYYTSCFIGILIHEAGHAIAALFVGHSIIEFSAGPICVKKAKRKYRVFMRRGFFTGLIKYERDFTRTSWKSEVLIIASGVLANFLAGGIALIYFAFSNSHAFFAIFGSISLFLGFINLFPVRSRSMGVDSDARRFIDMINFARNRKDNACKYTAMDREPLTLMAKIDLLKSPSQIEFFNDDRTPMDYVMCVLKKCFDMDDYAAAVLMMSIHSDGSAKVGWIDGASASGCVEFINQKSKNLGFPFTCRVVPLQS